MILVCKAINPITPSSSIGWPRSKRMLNLKTRSLVIQTFRQSSTYREDLPDPANLLYGCPSYRLDAEVLRDMALWSSGLLDLTMGGEGVKPYQPPNVEGTDASGKSRRIRRDKGQRLSQEPPRSLEAKSSSYDDFVRRTQCVSCVRRSRTNTSSVIALFNEPQRGGSSEAG